MSRVPREKLVRGSPSTATTGPLNEARGLTHKDVARLVEEHGAEATYTKLGGATFSYVSGSNTYNVWFMDADRMARPDLQSSGEGG